MKAAAVIAASLLVSAPTIALANDDLPRSTQSQDQYRGETQAEFQQRLNNARTPAERARIQADRNRLMQQGAVPDYGNEPRHGPRGSTIDPGQSSGGGGSVPKGQSAD